MEVKDNNTAVLRQGKQIIEVPVRAETAASKFSTTQVQYTNSNNLQEIRIGGTATNLVFGANNQGTGSF